VADLVGEDFAVEQFDAFGNFRFVREKPSAGAA